MKNEIKVFGNDNFNVKVMIDENGDYQFDAESVAASLGLTERKGAREYVMWRRVNQYLKLFGTSAEVSKGSYIPEPAVYKLTFKASNEVAENFQDWLAVEVLPSLRKTGFYEMPKEDKPKKNLSSANMLVKTVSGIFKEAGVSPLYIAAEAKRLYKEQADIDIQIPLITDKETMPKLYDCTEIAKELGIMSASGKPHNQAVSAILSKLDIEETEIVRTAFSRNGHDDVTTQYKPSVYAKVHDWLENNDFPSKIPYTDSKGNYKTYSVVYREVA